jgi:hypothetical protein
MAWVPVGNSGLLLQLDTSSSFGQRNDGGDDTTAWLQGETETNVSFLGMKGPWTAWADFEFDDWQSKTASRTVDRNNSYVQYAVNKQLTLKVGTIHHNEGLQYALSGGMVTATYQKEGWDYSGWAEENGFEVGFKLSPTMALALRLYGNTAIAMSGINEGSATAIGFTGKFGDSIDAKLGYISETYDDFQSSADEAQTNTITSLGVKVGLGAAMSVSLDYSTGVWSWNTADRKETSTDLALQFRMGGLGPGGIIFTYGSTTLKDPDEAYVVHWNYGVQLVSQYDIVDTNLAYEIPMGPGKMQFQYASKAVTPKDGDTMTATWMGVGFDFKI